MKKMAVALGMALVLLATSVAEANGRHHGGGGYYRGGHHHGGHYRGGYYRGGYGWGGWGGWGGGWGYGWGGGWGGVAVYPRVVIGGPYWWGNPYPYYGYPYYFRPLVIERSEPQIYVQQPQSEPQYWYYCEKPKGYYPSVKKCRNEWLKVVPRSDAPNE